MKVAAGLPNIREVLGVARYGSFTSFGTLVNVVPDGSTAGIDTSGNASLSKIVFDASKVASTYGNSATVQPPTVKLAPAVYLGKLA